MSNFKFSEMNEKVLSKNTSKNKFSIGKYVPSQKISLFLIFLVQLVILFFVLNPFSLLSQLNLVQVMNEVSNLTAVPPTEVPSIVAIIGDGKNLPDIEAIKSQNQYNAEVYKDAQNGDYVLAFEDKLIIYRKAEGKIVYEGDNPTQLVNKTQEKLINDITAAAKTKAIIAEDSEETPQISLITDIKSLQATEPQFYVNARNNDIIALFAQAEVIALFNQETGEIFQYGAYKTQISPR